MRHKWRGTRQRAFATCAQRSSTKSLAGSDEGRIMSSCLSHSLQRREKPTFFSSPLGFQNFHTSCQASIWDHKRQDKMFLNGSEKNLKSSRIERSSWQHVDIVSGPGGMLGDLPAANPLSASGCNSATGKRRAGPGTNGSLLDFSKLSVQGKIPVWKQGPRFVIWTYFLLAPTHPTLTIQITTLSLACQCCASECEPKLSSWMAANVLAAKLLLSDIVKKLVHQQSWAAENVINNDNHGPRRTAHWKPGMCSGCFSVLIPQYSKTRHEKSCWSFFCWSGHDKSQQKSCCCLDGQLPEVMPFSLEHKNPLTTPTTPSRFVWFHHLMTNERGLLQEASISSPLRRVFFSIQSPSHSEQKPDMLLRSAKRGVFVCVRNGTERNKAIGSQPFWFHL